MESIWIILLVSTGLLMAVFGLVACLLPVVPGPPVSYLSLLLLSWTLDWQPFSAAFLLVMAGLTVLVLLLDYVIPLIGARRVGASRYGIWGSVLGMVAGLFLFPPFGLFVGGLVGAMAGELYAGKGGDEAVHAGVGVFAGSLLGVGVKLAFCGTLLFLYVKALF